MRFIIWLTVLAIAVLVGVIAGYLQGLRLGEYYDYERMTKGEAQLFRKACAKAAKMRGAKEVE